MLLFSQLQLLKVEGVAGDGSGCLFHMFIILNLCCALYASDVLANQTTAEAANPVPTTSTHSHVMLPNPKPVNTANEMEMAAAVAIVCVCVCACVCAVFSACLWHLLCQRFFGSPARRMKPE